MPKPIAIVHVVTSFGSHFEYVFQTQDAMEWGVEWFRESGRRFYIEWTGEQLTTESEVRDE